MRLYLASASARRAALLQQIGQSFQVIPQEVDEAQLPREDTGRYVRRVAEKKARCGAAMVSKAEQSAALVLGADTVVELDGEVFGKPGSAATAAAMLRRLSDRTHLVLTAFVLTRTSEVADADLLESGLSTTEVTFSKLSDEQILRYVSTEEPLDKAGSYAIQGYAARFVTQIKGSYSGVVGLPLFEVGRALARAGVGL